MGIYQQLNKIFEPVSSAFKNIAKKIPGRTIFKEFRASAVPPLWVWLRATTFATVGVTLLVLGYSSIAKTVFVLVVFQFFGLTLARLFQSVANGLKRFVASKKSKDG